MGKTEREPCAFCPATADITGEHLWDAWAGRAFGKRRYTITRKEKDGRVLTWNKPKPDSKGNVVCSRCNNGWMSRLTDRMKAIAEGMVCTCAQTVLQVDDVTTLVAFGFMKAVVADHMHENSPPFYSFSTRHTFRRTLTVPEGTQMWLASLPTQRGLFKSMTIKSEGIEYPFALNVFTWGLGHLVIQVVGCKYRQRALRRHAGPLTVMQNPVWDQVSIPCWPAANMPIHWPPSAHIDGQAVDEFVVRWSRLTRG